MVKSIPTKVYPWVQDILTPVHFWVQANLNKFLLWVLSMRGLGYIHAPIVRYACGDKPGHHKEVRTSWDAKSHETHKLLKLGQCDCKRIIAWLYDELECDSFVITDCSFQTTN